MTAARGWRSPRRPGPGRASRQQPRRQRDADDRLEQHQDAGPHPADQPDPGQEPERRDGGGERSPVNSRSGRTSGVGKRQGERLHAAGRRGRPRPRRTPTTSRTGHRLLGRDVRVAVASDHDEDRLADRGAEGEGDAEHVEADPRRRVELRRDDRDHAAERQREGQRPGCRPAARGRGRRWRPRSSPDTCRSRAGPAPP